MFLLALIVIGSIVPLSGASFDNYPGFNAKAIKSTIKRGPAYASCMTYLNTNVGICVGRAINNPNQAYLGKHTTFNPPNRCHVGLLPNMNDDSYCHTSIGILSKIDTELHRRQFNVTYGLLHNSNITLAQLRAIELTPDTIIISW